MPPTYDIAVIGGGVMGCATLHYLAKLGVTNTVLLERDGLADGSTGRSMAILRMHYSNAVTTEMAWWSRAVIAEFEEETGHPGGFVNTGYLFLVKPGHEEALRRNVELGQRHGVETEMISPEEAQQRWPDMRFDGVGAVAYEPLSGYADSSGVTVGFARSARSHGAQVRLGAEVTAITTQAGRATAVELNGETVTCGAVLIAAGPWIPEFLDRLGAPLPISWVRHQVIRIHRPLDLVPSHRRMTIGDSVNGQSFRPDSGDTTLVATREDPIEEAGWEGRLQTDAGRRCCCPIAHPPCNAVPSDGGGFNPRGTADGAGLFTITPDWHPVLDRVPGYDNVYVAATNPKIFRALRVQPLSGPAIGRALAELITNISSVNQPLSTSQRRLRFSSTSNTFDEGDLLQSAYGRTVYA